MPFDKIPASGCSDHFATTRIRHWEMRRYRAWLVFWVMTPFKNPSFQDRAGQAAAEKIKALAQLRRRPEPDEESVVRTKAAAERREALRAGNAARKRKEAEEAAEEATAAKTEAVRKAAEPVPTEAERKAQRDLRYAARQTRKKN
ncbi:hypothetical protein HMF7854_10880 [Sphingomonas ginkgonis]|uniref:Uncharacterized protein n=1 Tax=Sphingomonas ginkgonis TaxID=2315330 RepID=A0A3R9WTA0_9SPHN|nr:DUF6481 family protein [Sphingomonas ginkgonis]RST31283.1 hypothetical protein HMF7854_10880 [Sphingomonas ginkgonis]